MSEGAINLLLSKIQPLTREEAGLSKDARKDLGHLIRSLTLLKNQLKLVETRASTENHARTWVERVQQIIALIHRVIDDCQHEIANIPDGGIRHIILHLLQHFVRWPFHSERQLAAQLQDITTQLNKIIDDMHDMFLEITDTLPMLTERQVSSPEPGPEGNPPSPLDLKAVGLEGPLNKLVKWLVEGGDPLTVISVLGMAGLGKTTLALLAFNHTRVKAYFECFAWITITRPFNLDSMFRSMIEQFYQSRDEEAPPDLEVKDLDGLASMIENFLQQKRYIIVLDKVSSTDLFEYIKYRLPKNSRSRILVTTPLVEVAYTCATTYSFVYNHQPLNLPNAWALFCNKVQAEADLPPELEKMAKEMVKRCSGLPLAIVTLAGLLSTKQKTEQEWFPVHQKLRSLFDSDIIKNILSICYDDLPEYLKPCFLYFGLFPENLSMDRTSLIRLWLAEEFVQKGEQGTATTEDGNAESYLNNLIQRNLVHASEVDVDGRVRSCRVHEISHAMIISKLAERKFGAKSAGFSIKIDQQSPRLSIQGNVEYPSRDTKSQHLSSLLIFYMSSWPKSCMHTIFIRSSLLKVLDLSNAPLAKFPTEIPTMPHLRYLSLRNTKLNKLPNSIGKLKQLITLDLKGTSILELPYEILKLEHLQHLLVHPRSQQRLGMKISFGITHLRTLQKLSLIDVSNRIRTIKGIKKLTQLRRLGITNLPKGDGKDLCSSLEEMKNLQSLSITPRDDEFIDLETLRTPPPLQRLYFHGSLEKLPSWIKKLTNLAKIKLRLAKVKENSLALLEELPNLKMLKLEEQANDLEEDDLEELSLKEGGFKKLKTLHLYHFEKLKKMKIEKGALPSLQKLYMQNSKQLEKLPQGINDLCEFKELHLVDMPESLSKDLIDKGEYTRAMPTVRSYKRHEGNASMVFIFSSNNSSSSPSTTCNISI